MEKFTKKSLAILIIAVMLTSLIPNLISFAVDAPVVDMTVSGSHEVEADVGKPITLDLNLVSGLPNQKHFSVVIGYNPEYLRPSEGSYFRDENSENKMAWDIGTGLSSEILAQCNSKVVMGIECGKYEEGNIYEGIALSYNAVDRLDFVGLSGSLGKLKFDVLKGGKTDIVFAKVAYSDGGKDSEDIEYPSSSKVTITAPIPMTGLKTTPVSKDLKKGETFTVLANKEPVETTDKNPITYRSSNEAVATVNANGVVTAVGNGTADITAVCGSFSVKCATVNVTTALTGISLNQSSVTLNNGGETKLVATKNPTDASQDINVTWSSSNESVATVSQDGTAKAVGNGDAVITATAPKAEGGNVTATCNIKVITPLNKLVIDKKELTLSRGETSKLTVTKDPESTTVTDNIVWSSSDETKVKVSQDGTVTALAATGETPVVIKATCAGKEVTCSVSVGVPISKITITNGDITLKKSQTENLTVSYEPTDFTGSKAIKWSSSDETKVKVENGVITAVAPTEKDGVNTPVVITAETVNGIKGTINVTVPEVKSTELIINKNKTSIEKGSEETLEAKILPEDTTDELDVTWTSSDETKVEVENGVVKAIAPTETPVIVTATASNGLKATCEVTVTCSLESITLNETALKIEAGEEATTILVVTKNPTDATVDVADVKWESLAPTIATVENGKVTAVQPGTTYIRATLDGKVAECKVDVIATLKSVSIENSTDNLEVYKNKTGEMKVVYNPSYATEIPEATWTSSNEKVATVDNNGIVTGIKEGTAKITVDYGNGITASRVVKVKEVKATGVTIIVKPETLLKNEESVLEINVSKDENETGEITDEIIWTSSDETVAKVVFENGQYKVKGIKEGKAEITVQVGDYTDTFEVEVKEKPITSIDVSIFGDTNTIEEDGYAGLKITVNPSDTTDDQVFSYKSENEAIAKVVKGEDGNIYVKGINAGTTKIIVTAENGVEGVYEVTVVAKKITEEQGTTNNTGSSSGPAPAAPAPVQAVQQAVSGLTTSPHTGDMNVIALAVMAVISLAGMIITIKKK